MAAKGSSEAKQVRTSKALDLRIAGGSYRQIGRQRGVSEFTAYYDVQGKLAALDAVIGQQAERLRDLEAPAGRAPGRSDAGHLLFDRRIEQ